MILREPTAGGPHGAAPERAETRALLDAFGSGEFAETALAKWLCSLAARGESAEQIEGAAEAFLATAVPFEHPFADALHVCDAGADARFTFNLASVAALIAAATGARVVLHGERSLTGGCSGADLLASAGLPLDLDACGARTVLEETGKIG
jgi:anthranilate phosphoribosyltransferase